MPSLRLVLAQLNVTVGDLTGNERLIARAIRHAQAWRADVILIPELAVPGYPPEDLLLKPQFVEANRQVVRRLAPTTRGIIALVGYAERDPQGRLSNAAALLSDGRHVATYRKQHLPNYGVFDEARYFAPGSDPVLFDVGGTRLGVTICEDLWKEEPCRVLARAGAQLVVNLSASPYHVGKLTDRQTLFARRARQNHLAIAFCNLVGGQDELVFDGASLILDARGRLLAHAAQFHEDMLVLDLGPAQLGPVRSRSVRAVLTRPAVERPPLPPPRWRTLEPLEEIYEALLLGVCDYVRKNGFSTVILGLSGGVDSALTACLAVDALGPAHVVGLVMPSRYSSVATQRDAKQLGAALGIAVQEVSIEPMFQAALKTLAPSFAGQAEDTTEQNLQARIRGMILMALSNKFGWLVLTTGNKSEIATGYCTLYGDMVGGLAVIKDVPKMLVYRLARYRNQHACLPRQGEAQEARRRQGPIPESIFQRPPSAELARHQTDQDTLPPYEMLDRLLKSYVEENRSLRQILHDDHVDPSMVRRVIRMVDHAEYKRRQGAPGIKITPRAFGRDRRMPITNRYAQS